MKKRVGVLNNIPIVEGDPNLLTNKELLHKGGGQLSKRNVEGKIEDLGSGNSSSSCEEEYYFLFTEDEIAQNPYIAHMIQNVMMTDIMNFSAKVTYPGQGIIYINAITGMSGIESILGYSLPRIFIVPDVFRPMDFLDFVALHYATQEASAKTKEEILQIVDNYKKEVLQFQVTKEEYYENSFLSIEDILASMG